MWNSFFVLLDIYRKKKMIVLFMNAYDDDPNRTCGREMVECEHRVHISILPMKCVQCTLQESCLHNLFTKI